MNTEAKSEESKGQEAAQKDELISIEIDKARKAGMNMLLPSAHIESLSELHSPILDYVDLSPEVSDGDVYYHGESKKLVLTKKGLMKLARAAGIVWHPVETRRSDNRADRNYVSYRALGGVRTADGAIAWIPGEYDLDLEVIEDELRDLYERKGKKSSKKGDELQGYVDYCVKRDLLYKRKHRVKLCETGAMTRVIRTLLVDLKAGYTKQELQRTFVIARIVFRPDFSNPQIRKKMIDKAIDATESIYGDDQMMYLHSPEEAKSEILDTFEESGIKTIEPPKEPEADTMSHKKADFEAADEKGQIDTLKTLAKRKGYDLKQLTKPLDEFTDDQRGGFFDKLMEMADLDMPF